MGSVVLGFDSDYLIIIYNLTVFKKFKFLGNVIGLCFVGWLIFSPTPPDKNVPRDFGSINVAVQNKYSEDEQNYLVNENSKIILASNSRDESDSDSDIEEDTQFVLPEFPVDIPIGGFINLQTYATYSRDVKTLETPSPPMFVQPKLNPDWFRPEINPQFTTLKDRKLQHQRSLSLAAERKVNQKRRKQKKPYYGVAVKMGKEFYHPYPQLRDKFHHAPCIGVPIPITLENEMDDLAINSNYAKRIQTFRNRQKLPPEYVEVAAIKLREHVIDPDTYLLKGTLGKRQEARRKRAMKQDPTLKPLPHRKGFLLYNSKTNLVAFYEEKTRRLVTYLIPRQKQIQDIQLNQNIL